MRGDRETDPDALMARYDIGRRLAVRVVALLSRQIDVTETVLAAAGEEEEAARLLLSPRLLKDPPAVTEQWLQERAEELGFSEAELLRLVPGPEGEWRTIALEDDLLAAGVEQEAEAAAEGEPLELVRAGPRDISERETEELFAPEEVATLKLSALTSQNPEERIESLRKLVFAPLKGAQKASIFLNVLTDREAATRVRREAVRSLEQIGFRADMAEAVRGLFSEDEEEAVYAVQRLSALLQEAEEGEAALVVAVVLEVLDQTRSTDIACELLRLAARSSGMLVTNYQKSEQFFRSAVRQLSRDFDGVRYEVERAVAACAREASGLVADLIWSELQRSENARVRSLLLNLYESVAQSPQQVEELAERAVGEILNPELPESEKARLRYALVRLGEPAAMIAIEKLPTATPGQKSELIRVLDVVCTESEVSDETVQRTVKALLDQLKLADTLTRRTILQAALLGDERIEGGLRREMARELLSLMADLNLPESLELVRTTLEKIGLPALEPAFSFIERSYPGDAGELTALAMAEIMEQHPREVGAELADKVLELCRNLLADEALESGTFALAMAAVCGYTDRGAEAFEPCLRSLRDVLWQKPYSTEILDALAVMAGSQNAQPEHQEELFELFDAIVRYQAPSAMGEVEETEEGTVYKFGREVEFDIQIVPVAVRGLKRICVSPQASMEMRTEIVKRLLVLWEGVANVRVIWGPAAIDALVRAMSGAACMPEATTQMKIRLGESLLRFLNKTNVVRNLAQVFGRTGGEPRLRQLAVQAGNEMLNEWEAADRQDEERRLALLRTITSVAANPDLSAEDEDVRKLRERTLDALFRALRDGVTQVREQLLEMRDCEGVPEDRRREIDERLGKVFGVVKTRSAS